MVYVSAVVLTVLNLVFWVGMRFHLPGTWLMVLVTALLTWWRPGHPRPDRLWWVSRSRSPPTPSERVSAQGCTPPLWTSNILGTTALPGMFA
jgi:hypothetical protein